MSDSEFSIPFERAFKRLRVDGGDLPADDDSDGEDRAKRDKLSIQPANRPTSSALTSNDVPCAGNFSSSKMWRPVDQFADRPVSAEEPPSFLSHPLKPAITSVSYLHKTADSRSMDERAESRPGGKPSIGQPANELRRTKVKSSSNTELTQNCSNQARNEPEINVNELAAYLDCQLFLPKKMSFMASLAYS